MEQNTELLRMLQETHKLKNIAESKLTPSSISVEDQIEKLRRLRPSSTVFTSEKADTMARKLNFDDPSWQYRPVHVDGGQAYIECYDENGNYLGTI